MPKKSKVLGDGEVTSRMQDVTPEWAKRRLEETDAAVLEGKMPQRTRRPHLVDKHARAMQEGRWRTNGQSISLSPEGWVVNGQHRLAAVVKTGLTIRMIVALNVPVDSFATIDMGGRTLPDVFDQEMGRKGSRSRTLSTAIRLLHRYENRAMLEADRKKGQADPDELLEFLRNNMAIRDCFPMADRLAKAERVMSVAVGLFCYHVFRRHNVAAAEEFMSSLAEGIGLEKGSPILVLRRRLLGRLGAKTMMRAEEMAALTFKAWVLFLRGEKGSRNLVWRKDEDFPYLENGMKRRRRSS